VSRFLDLANLISILGVCSALAGALLATQGRLAFAAAALVGAGFCDVFDGFVARKLTRDEAGKTFGQRLDSLVDACAFGISPVFLLHAAGMRSLPEQAALLLFASCAVWRLAYFETFGLVDRPPEQPGEKPALRYYHGLPTTFVSTAIPAALLAGLHSAAALRVVANVAAVGLAVAMVSPLPFPKPRGVAYPILSLLALALLTIHAVLGVRGGFPAP